MGLTKIPPDWRKYIGNRVVEYNKERFPDLKLTGLLALLEKETWGDWTSIIPVVNRYYAKIESKKRWGDKTPGYVMHLPLIKELFPEAKVIHMVRDGRDVIPSILKYWSVGPQTTSLMETAFYWKRHVSRGVELGPKLFGENYMELKYEDLVSNPEMQIRKVCDFIGEVYEASMMDRSMDRPDVLPDREWHKETQKQINDKNVGKWKVSLSTYEVMVIQNYARGLLRKFEYDLEKGFSMRALRDVSGYRIKKWYKNKYLSFKVGIYSFLASNGFKKKARL
ncbi:hypothetical protein MASR2M41_13970 [Flammeovirgaceae bacterium]